MIGQSLPMHDVSYLGQRIASGAEVFAHHVNATGGVNGRKLRIVTLDDGGDPRRHAENLHALIGKHGAIAIINCVGDQSCRAAASVAAASGVPLVGPISGARMLRSRYVFPIRPVYEREAAAMAGQLQAMGVGSLAILTDAPKDAEPLAELTAALVKAQIKFVTHKLGAAGEREIGSAMSGLARERHSMVVFNLEADALNALAEHSRGIGYEWPLNLAVFGSRSLQALGSLFRDRVIGFASVVPNPEASSSQLAMEFLKQSERIGDAAAVSFDGLEAYLNLKVCVEALRRSGLRPDRERLTQALETLQFDAGNFPISFMRGRGTGSDWIEIGLRTRDGRFVR